MRLERTERGFQIDAADLGPLLGIPPADAQRLMRAGRITSLHEAGQGEDAGRHRITFRHGATRVRFTVDETGEVLLRTRTTVAPRPGSADTITRQRPSVAPLPVPLDDPAALTRHIEMRYHARHFRQLPDLVRLAEMVEDLHDGDRGVPDGLTVLLRRMTGEMETHIKKQELILFPAIEAGQPGIDAQIARMRAQHAGHAADLARIRKLTDGFALPESACSSWATLIEWLKEFANDLSEHLRLENEVLFAHFETQGTDHV